MNQSESDYDQNIIGKPVIKTIPEHEAIRTILRTEHEAIRIILRTEHEAIRTILRTEHEAIKTILRPEHEAIRTITKPEHEAIRTILEPEHEAIRTILEPEHEAARSRLWKTRQGRADGHGINKPPRKRSFVLVSALAESSPRARSQRPARNVRGPCQAHTQTFPPRTGSGKKKKGRRRRKAR